MGCFSRLLAAQAMIPEMPILCNEGPNVEHIRCARRPDRPEYRASHSDGRATPRPAGAGWSGRRVEVQG
jgi:hypothetical protein